MIFSRQRSGAGRHKPGRHAATGRDASSVGDLDQTGPDGPATDEPTVGPYDISAAPDDGLPRLDLGALLVPAVDGVELRVQAAPDGQIQQVMLVDGDSSLHLGVFAAPRTDGVWDEIRSEITQSLVADGGRAAEVDGPYGPQLNAQLPASAGGGHLRYVGVDGPRWFVRAVFQGAAAIAADASPRLELVLSGLVVVRGDQAQPVREPLPLRLPKEMLAQAAGGGEPDNTGPRVNGARVNGGTAGRG